MKKSKHTGKAEDYSGEQMDALIQEFFGWLPRDLAIARANRTTVPFYIHIDPKTGELIELLFGQAAIDAMTEVENRNRKIACYGVPSNSSFS